IAACCALLHFTLGVHDHRLHAKERLGRRAGLEPDCAGQGRDEAAARLGLRPRIDDRATTFSDNAVVPLPCLGVYRLAYRTEQTQGCVRSFLYPVPLPPPPPVCVESSEGARS